jgi:hypothetical protein
MVSTRARPHPPTAVHGVTDLVAVAVGYWLPAV